SCLAGEDGLKRLPLPLICLVVDEQTQRGLCACPDVAFEAGERNQIETVKSDIAKMPPAGHARRACPDRHCWSAAGQIRKGRECCSCRCRTSRRRRAILELCSSDCSLSQ